MILRSNVALTGRLGLVILFAILTHPSDASSSTNPSLYTGFIGCRFSESVCRRDERCFDDLLFGTCQKRFDQDDFQWDDLSSSQLSALEDEIGRLIAGGYSWRDLYTQCVLGNALLAFRMGRDFDRDFCDTRGGEEEVEEEEEEEEEPPTENEELIQDALNLLEEYIVEEDKSTEEASPLYLNDDGYFSHEKKDELIDIHKYQKNKKHVLPEIDSPFADQKLNDYVDESYDSWSSDEIAALQEELDREMEPEYVEREIEMEEDAYPGAEDASDVDEDLSMSAYDAKLLGSLLTGEISTSSLSDDEIERLSKIVDGVLVGIGEEEIEDLQPRVDIPNDINSIEENEDKLAAETEPQYIYDLPEESKRIAGQVSELTPGEAADHHDHGLARAQAIPTNKPQYAVVDARFVDLQVQPKLITLAEAEYLLDQLAFMLQVDVDDFSHLSVHEGHMNFRVDSESLNATYVGSYALGHSEQLKNKTGFGVVKASLGSALEEESQVDIAETGDQGPKYFVLTFVLCGVIAGVVLAVIAVYMVRRHSQIKTKLANIASASNDTPAVSSDYQDLCRQRMQSKASEKPEPLHVASRVGSVSATEQAIRSPSSRSSTSSWSEEPVTTNMDISTGHIVLSYMEDHLKNRERLAEEWRGLEAYEAEPNVITVATQAANTRKNRYTDILPYDHSRVVLNSATNVSGSDYINANSITDHDPRNPAYVATQGPLPHTVADFWQMVWEQGSVVIVNLTRLSEEGVAMCHRYWPEEGSDLYHIYEVHLVSEHIWCEDYLVRSFYLKNLQTNETRTVTQFHFLSWSDLSVPNSAKALLDFRRKVNKSYRGRSCPVIVHGSDGVGRTGTYILIDMVLNRMSKGAKEIDIAATLEHIRDQRVNMVKTKEQFEYALAAVAEEVHAILKALPQ